MICQKDVTLEGTRIKHNSVWVMKKGFADVTIKLDASHTDTLGDYSKTRIATAVKKMVAELNEEN